MTFELVCVFYFSFSPIPQFLQRAAQNLFSKFYHVFTFYDFVKYMDFNTSREENFADDQNYFFCGNLISRFFKFRKKTSENFGFLLIKLKGWNQKDFIKNLVSERFNFADQWFFHSKFSSLTVSNETLEIIDK